MRIEWPESVPRREVRGRGSTTELLSFELKFGVGAADVVCVERKRVAELAALRARNSESADPWSKNSGNVVKMDGYARRGQLGILKTRQGLRNKLSFRGCDHHGGVCAAPADFIEQLFGGHHTFIAVEFESRFCLAIKREINLPSARI